MKSATALQDQCTKVHKQTLSIKSYTDIIQLKSTSQKLDSLYSIMFNHCKNKVVANESNKTSEVNDNELF